MVLLLLSGSAVCSISIHSSANANACESQLIQHHAVPLDSKSPLHAILCVSFNVDFFFFSLAISMFSTLLQYWLTPIYFHWDMGKSLLQIPGNFLKSSQQCGVFEIRLLQRAQNASFENQFFLTLPYKKNCELSSYFISCLIFLFKIMTFIYFLNFPLSA